MSGLRAAQDVPGRRVEEWGFNGSTRKTHTDRDAHSFGCVCRLSQYLLLEGGAESAVGSGGHLGD
jgi:hypothetical protein